jgi:hypothetical protein
MSIDAWRDEAHCSGLGHEALIVDCLGASVSRPTYFASTVTSRMRPLNLVAPCL